MELNEILKELDTNLVIRKIEKSDKILYLYCDIDCTIVKCKYCGRCMADVNLFFFV